MARGACTFRQRDVTAAVKAVVAAGVPVARVEIDKSGTIRITTSKPGEVGEAISQGANEWDGAS